MESLRSSIQTRDHNLPVMISVKINSQEELVVDKDGIIQLPSKQPDGHHALLVVGFSPDEEVWFVKNSYGKYWGDEGFAKLPFQYRARSGNFCHIIDVKGVCDKLFT